jgi:tryptophan-rich sensory protein
MAHQSLKTQSLGLAGWLLATLAAGSVGAIASAQAATFYAQLSQPSWAPPAWLFGPVWSVLYVLMAVSAWLIWRECGFKGASTALWLFVIQLVANALFSTAIQN